jgi:hypothetical protein
VTVTTQLRADEDLASVLAHRRWVRRARPFPHVVASDVFVPDFYADLESHFRRLQQSGSFGKTIRNYDAGNANLRDHADGPLGIFGSRAWHDLVAGLFGVRATGDITVGLHSHPPGGRRGWPHNDLNPGWFPAAAPQPDEARFDSPEIDYQRGTRPDGVEARETVRGVAVLYYLANAEWQPGDGGETSLYAGGTAGTQGIGVRVPPVNNSLVMFECTPFSWHSYAGSARNERNCLVMWVHRSKDDVIATWGEQSIAHW